MHDTFLRSFLASGLQANNDKSFLYITGVSKQTKQVIVNALGLNLGTLPYKYLGVPLVTKKLHINAYLLLIDKITTKITC